MTRMVLLEVNLKMSTLLNRKRIEEMFQMIVLRSTLNIAHLMKNETRISLMKSWRHRDQYHVLQENRDCHSEVAPQTKSCLKIIKLCQARTNLETDNPWPSWVVSRDLLTNRISVFSQTYTSVQSMSINANWEISVIMQFSISWTVWGSVMVPYNSRLVFKAFENDIKIDIIPLDFRFLWVPLKNFC